MTTIERPRWIDDVLEERANQRAEWDDSQSHPDGTGHYDDRQKARLYRDACDLLEKEHGTATWRVILLEEVYEALAESNIHNLRKELVQAAAVIGAWIEDIDTRG